MNGYPSIDITIEFSSGEKRTYQVVKSIADDIFKGALLRMEIMHPEFGEHIQVTLHEGKTL